MRPADRHQQILDMVNQQGNITVDALCEKFHTSPETIRRDLGQLSATGKLRKVHGGATRASSVGEGPFYQRFRRNVEAKRTIAKLAASLISPGDALFVDTGTTTLVFAEEIAKINGLTVVSNSVDIIRILDQGSGEDKSLHLLGGRYHGINGETLGNVAISQLEKFRPHYAVVAVGAIDAEAGLTDYDEGEADLAAAMLGIACSNIILTDSSKFESIGGYHVAPLANVDRLVTDIPASGLLHDRLLDNNVELVHPVSVDSKGIIQRESANA
ncbi:MAG: DeoR/GlpR family transcriptional regulator of sugar metabolism [Saprospiraceae bacterium]|jgi:DeoR/GlpR family transcriptional regulator of sugar metabolism